MSLTKAHKPASNHHHSNNHQSFVQQTVLSPAQKPGGKDNQTENESARDVQSQVQLRSNPFGAEPFVRQTVFGQAKLNIGKPNDKYEVEADRVADKVVAKSTAEPAKPAAAPPPVQKKDAGGPEEGEGVSEEDVQMMEAPEKETEIQEKPISESITPLVQLKPIAATEDSEVQKMEAESESEAEIQTKLDASTESPETVQKMEAPGEESDVQKTAIQTKCASCGAEESSEKLSVQQKCASCEGEEAVQKMDAPTEESEVQTKLDASTEAPEAVQKMEAPAEESDVQKTAIQTKCASCGAEESPEKLNVQQKCASCESEEPVQKMEAPTEESEVQTKLDASTEAPKTVQKMEAPGEESSEVQMKSDSASSSGADVESSLKSSKGKGSAMDDNTRSSMESGFGADFSGVRIHTDSTAVQMNKSLGSQAFTNGSDVYFNEGKYNPSSNSGQHLLAHELTHTVQQGASPKGIQQKNESTKGDEATVQTQLEVNATRLHEPKIKNNNKVSSAANKADKNAKKEKKDEKADKAKAEDLTNEADQGSENDGNANENTNAANTGQGGAVTVEANGENQGNCEPECYREPTEEPEEEPDEEPENPEAAQVEAEADDGGQEDVWEEIDDCPTEQAEAAGATVEPSEGATAEGGPKEKTEGKPDQEKANPKNKENAEKKEGDAEKGGDDKKKEPALGGNELEGIISSAEGERAKSVAAYQASSSSLSGTSSQNEAVKGQVNFVPNSSETAEQNTLRQQATGRANDFFSSIGNRLADATAFGLEDIPNRVGPTAEAAKAQIAASMEAQKSAISARIAGARGEAKAKAKLTRLAVQTQTKNYISDVEAQTATAIETLNTTYTDTMTNIGDLETTTLDTINEMYVQGRSNLINLGPTIGNECKATARAMAAEYRGFRNCTENGYWDGNLSQRRANAQAEAAISVGQTYYDRMVDSAREQAIEVTKNGRKVDRCSIIASANQSRSTLDESLPQLIKALESTRDAAIEQAKATETSLIAGIDAALTSTLDHLDEQEYTQRQAINDTGYMQQVMQESIAHAAAAATQQGIQSGVSSVQNSLFELKTLFASKQAPDPQEFGNVLTQVEQNINAAVDGLFSSANTGISTAETQLNNNLQQAIASLQGITQSNEETTSKLMGDFTTGMDGISGVDNFAAQRTSFITQVQQSVDSSTAALVQSFDGFQQSCNGTIEQATLRLADAEVSLDENLRQNQQGLECEITASADEAASKEAPAWKQLLAVLIIILVVIIIIALTVVTAGAAGPVIVAALGGPLLAGAIIGAVVGAVVSGLIAMATNLWTNQDVMTGVGEAMLVGFITGAAGGFLGAAAGAGTGLLFQGASKGVQLATQFGAAMISGGGFDIVTQYIQGGFSFDNFSWGQLAFTLFTTGITFGIGHVAGTRANAGAINTPETNTVIDTPEANPVVNAPESTPVVNTPESTPVIDTPESTPVVDTPESTPVVDTPESTPVVDGPESTPVVDTPESTPVVDTPESTPVVDTPESTPVVDTPESTPVVDTPESTPVVDTPESTPVVDTPESTPVVDTPESTPVVDTPESTPVTDTPENTPVNDGPENIPVNDETDVLPPTKEEKVRVIRQDNDFNATQNDKGVPKSHLEDGAMVPADPEGNATPLEHIYGSQPAKGESPYTSFLTEEGGVAKPYGSMEVELDLPRLQTDIAEGNLVGVEVLTPADLDGMIRADINTVTEGTGVTVDADAGIANGPAGIDEYVANLGLSRSKSSKISRRLLALYNTTRDGEYLIRGIIPREYLTGPYATGN